MQSCPRLTDSQIQELKTFIKDKNTQSSEVKKAQTVLLINKKARIKDITELTGYHRRQIFILRKNYLKEGLSAIKNKRKGKPKELLTKKQLKEIYLVIKTKTPRDFNYDSSFWSTSILADFIKREYKISYKSKTSYYLIFKRTKFTYHKPGRVYVKRNEQEVLKWKIKTVRVIKEAWLEPETIILCGDEMLLSTQTTIQKIWLPEGEYPKIEVSNTRKNISIYGFLNLKTGQEHAFMAEKQTMIETERQLKKLRKFYPKQKYKLLILWDNPGRHRGSMVQSFIKKDKNIEVVYFPPYSPEENPQEHVWKEGRSKITHNQFIPNVDETAQDFVNYLNTKKFTYSLLGFSAKS